MAIIESLKAASGLREGKILSLMQASMPPLSSGSTVSYYTGMAGYEYVCGAGVLRGGTERMYGFGDTYKKLRI